MTQRFVAIAVAAAATLFAAGRLAEHRYGSDRLSIDHCPSRFTRRAGELTANVTGRWAGEGPILYRLDDGAWRTLTPDSDRFPDGAFTIELRPAELSAGPHVLAVRAGQREVTRRFSYTDEPVVLPFVQRWEHDLEVVDGTWERITVDGELWVRPLPGTEGYDRIVAATGALAGGRRVEVDVVLRKATHRDRMWGFGALPLWGGHVDDPEQAPQRGWSFAVAWYYSRPNGVGMEFSRRIGDGEAAWVASYRNAEVEPGRRYRIVAEAWPEHDAAGGIARVRQRMKWWAVDQPEPEAFLELVDRPSVALRETEFAVALVAHRCQAEFGPVRVSPVPPR
jgi:hypothetical protein